jgi:flagellar biosynthetic protein FliR
MGISMGLGMGSLIDPINGQESSASSQLMTFLALGFAVALGIHREAVAWLCRSIIELPPGVPADLNDLALRVITQATGALALAVRLAFPVLSAVTIGHMSLGLLGRVAPQMGLSNVGFAVALVAGMGAMYFVAPAAASVAAEAAHSALVVH